MVELAARCPNPVGIEASIGGTVHLAFNEHSFPNATFVREPIAGRPEAVEGSTTFEPSQETLFRFYNVGGAPWELGHLSLQGGDVDESLLLNMAPHEYTRTLQPAEYALELRVARGSGTTAGLAVTLPE